MGQTIQIWDANVVADVLLVSTDRSLTGQDGEAYSPGQSIEPEAIFPAQLAARLFESDPSIDHVYVMSNVLSLRRQGGWDDPSVASARDVVASFFLFYESQLPTEGEPASDAGSQASAETSDPEPRVAPEAPSPDEAEPASDAESEVPAEVPLQGEGEPVSDAESAPSEEA